MYPVYGLEQFVPISGEWVPIEGYPADDRPHHYDWLRKAYDKFVAKAKAAGGAGGYRIIKKASPNASRVEVVDSWEQETGLKLDLQVVASIIGPNGVERDHEARVLAYNRAAKELGWPTWGEASYQAARKEGGK